MDTKPVPISSNMDLDTSHHYIAKDTLYIGMAYNDNYLYDKVVIIDHRMDVVKDLDDMDPIV